MYISLSPSAPSLGKISSHNPWDDQFAVILICRPSCGRTRALPRLSLANISTVLQTSASSVSNQFIYQDDICSRWIKYPT